MAIGRRQSTESRALPSAGACYERVDGGCWSSASVASAAGARRRWQVPESPPPPVERVVPTGWDSYPDALRHFLFEPRGWDSDPPPPPPQQAEAEKPRMSWAVMAQQDELATATTDDDMEEGGRRRPRARLTREQRELHRFRNVLRKDVFICFVRVKGHLVNILSGLELHAGVFSTAKQKCIVDCVYDLQEMGKRGELGGGE